MSTAPTRVTRSPAGSLRPLEIDELVNRWQHNGDRRAQEELHRRFLPLARRLAARYQSPNEPMEDLVQVASVGLLGAINRFDPDRGASFTAFAIPTILGELKRHFRSTGWAAHVPRGAQEMALRIDRAARAIATETGRPASLQRVAEYLEIGIEDVLVGTDAGSAHYSVSLDAPAPGGETDEATSLGGTLGADDHRFGFVEVRLSLATEISRLPYAERRAVRLRLGNNMRQADIARELRCSQMQVSRLLRRATQRLHQQMNPELTPIRVNG